MGSLQSAVVRFLLRRSGIWNKPLDEIRKTMESIKSNGLPESIRISKVELNGTGCEAFISSEKKNNKAIIYYHGGGFCLGIYNANREFVARLAESSETDIYMPDYRLAPEHPFPAALEDAIAAYRGVLNKGYNASDIIIMGDSSGCALAVSAMLVLKQSGEKMPAAMAFITPVFDLAGNGESFITKVSKDPFQLKDPLGIAKIYIGENNPASPMLSPLYGDLEGLPQILIHAAEYDVFLSDSVKFTDIAKNAGAQVELKIWRKMWHIFHMQASLVPESKNALIEIGSFVSEIGGDKYAKDVTHHEKENRL